jgi:hypothetical protein
MEGEDAPVQRCWACDKCHDYGRIDHCARDCHQPKKRANLTEAKEDDEPALPMAMVEIEDVPSDCQICARRAVAGPTR